MKTNTKKLYIIGNGFDRYHHLDTQYQSFAFFLQGFYSDIYEYLINYFGLPDLDESDPNSLNDPLWAQFEEALAGLDFETVLDDNSDLTANPGSEDFKDGDWHSYQIEMEQIVEDLTTNLFAVFKEFVLSVEFPKNIQDFKLKLDPSAKYFTFNYTDTLERYYEVPVNNILYVHNKADSTDAVLVLGHAVDPTTFIPTNPTPPDGLDGEGIQYWREQMEDSYDFSYDSAKSEILSYYTKSFKKTKKIIDENRTFFNSLQGIDEIIVLGHSLSDVDMPYFKKIIESTKPKLHWFVTYYNEEEKVSHLQKLESIGIAKEFISLIQMTELK